MVGKKKGRNMAKKNTESINYQEALSIQANLNDKKLGEVVERYNDFIEQYERFENNTALSNLTFAEASLCAFDYAVKLDKENETGGFYQNLFRKWIEEFAWGEKESGKFGLWSGKVRDLLEKGLVLMFNITDENGNYETAEGLAKRIRANPRYKKGMSV